LTETRERLPDATPPETHFAALNARLSVTGLRILDIGCGSGGFMRQLLRSGADAHGFEVAQETVDRAVAAGIDRDRIALGDGSTLPFPDGHFDCATFVFSFHHVPAEAQRTVLAEAARVLRPGGTLVAIEPLPAGDMTEVITPIEDETEVRTNSQALLADPPAPFVLEEVARYAIARAFNGAEEFVRDAVEVDAARAERAARPEIAAEVAARYARLAEPLACGRGRLTQPCDFYRFSLA